MNLILYVFVGGGLGSLARFGISKLIVPRIEGINPVATLISNLVASLLLGLVMYTFSQKMAQWPQWRAFVATGFCGGFSTFSTFSYESLRLIQQGMWLWAAANVLVSVLAALFLMWILVQIGEVDF